MLQGGKSGQATLFLPGDDDQLEAAAQLVIGAAAIYDESFASITGAQVASRGTVPAADCVHTSLHTYLPSCLSGPSRNAAVLQCSTASSASGGLCNRTIRQRVFAAFAVRMSQLRLPIR